MTRFLRTASTRRLLATIAGVIAAIAAGTAIAVAAAGSGPVPPRTTLAKAVHRALAAPPIQGISGRISFTNHLIDSSDLTQGTQDPILSGASGRFWLSKNHLRLELQSDNGDAQVLVNNGSFWISDPAGNTVYEGSLPSHGATKDKSAGQDTIPSVADIQRDINRLVRHVNLSGAIPGDVAGQPVYTVKVSPKHDGGLLGNVQLAWDAVHGVPLRIGIYAQGQSSPVLQLKVTDISYGPVSGSVFSISPPAGDKVVRIASASHASGTAATGSAASPAGRAQRRRAHAEISGVAAVARSVPFTLAAPRSLDGLHRQTVARLDMGGTPAALVTYGENLGGVAVIEQQASAGTASQGGPNSGGGQGGLSLPTVSINGATAQELATPLGTVLRFTRGGVAYTVIGSVPPTAAELAARAL
jgi:outer membrane lipoprotein-sorting protein